MSLEHQPKIFDNILELVGDTPLVKLNTITKTFPGTYSAKLEAFNPGHSSKDRIALHIVEQAEKKGILKPAKTTPRSKEIAENSHTQNDEEEIRKYKVGHRA